jgi:hypothetical protein
MCGRVSRLQESPQCAQTTTHSCLSKQVSRPPTAYPQLPSLYQWCKQ